MPIYCIVGVEDVVKMVLIYSAYHKETYVYLFVHLNGGPAQLVNES